MLHNQLLHSTTHSNQPTLASRGAKGGAGTNPRYGGDGRRPTLVPP